MSGPEPLFPPSLLSSLKPTSSSGDSKSFSLPNDYSIRPLQSGDSSTGLLDVLRVLTTVGDITAERFEQRFSYMRAVNEVGNMSSGGASQGSEGTGGTYFVIVVCDGEGKVVGTGAVVVERKL